MNKAKALSVSIVIPVYNEEDYIGPCLDAIMAQTVKPLEVIIVDNNCTDSTTHIAKRYPLVRVVSETVQGRTVSRNRGFNAAKGDILGRIDADSVIKPNWVELVRHDFTDKSVGAITGPGETRLIFGLPIYSTVWSRVFFLSVQALHGIVTTWGANMAVRRTAWQASRHDTAPNGLLVHEDQDIAYVMVQHGYRVVQDNHLLIRTHGGSFLYWPKYWDYFKKTFRMKKHHDERGTLDHHRELCLGMPRRIAQALLTWPAAALFTLYSFVSWPIFKYGPSKIRSYR